MAIPFTHLAIDSGGKPRPLCGNWGESASSTKEPSAVSCPDCLARVARLALDRDIRDMSSDDPGLGR